jgi:hypothetical protein
VTERLHELKTWPDFYPAVVDGSKPFEVRRDDRGFQVGDVLWLREWEPGDPAREEFGEGLGGSGYTGRHCLRRVTYRLDLGWLGSPGLVALGLVDTPKVGGVLPHPWVLQHRHSVCCRVCEAWPQARVHSGCPPAPMCPTANHHPDAVPGTVHGLFLNRWNPIRTTWASYCRPCARLLAGFGVFLPDAGTCLCPTDEDGVRVAFYDDCPTPSHRPVRSASGEVPF